jgi:hypothetical protein
MKKILVSKSRREKIALIGKLGTAILLTGIMFLIVGVVQVKDSRKNASYCANCHEDYYNTWASDGASSYSLAHEHAKLSISCQTCHNRTIQASLTEIVDYVTGNYSFPLVETAQSDELCLSCHGSMNRVKSLTKTTITHATIDFHDDHHRNLSCSSCHNMHRDSLQVCLDCHPDDLLPGWVKPLEKMTIP